MKAQDKEPKEQTKQPESWPLLEQTGNVFVKIYRRRRADGSFGFEVVDYSAGPGNRRLISKPTLEAAQKEAQRIGRLLSAGEATAAQLNSREAASYGRAVELLRPTGIALELAAGLFAELCKILPPEKHLEAARFYLKRNPTDLPSRTVKEVVDELLAVKAARGASERYLQDLRSRLSRFADAFQKPVGEVLTQDIQAWFDTLKVSGRTMMNSRRALLTLWKFAISRGYVFKGENVVADTEKVSSRNGKAVTIYTPPELAKLFAHAPADFVAPLALCAFAGLRSAEAERVDWQDMDLAGGFVTVAAEKSKTRSRRLVPVSPALRAWLTPRAKKAGSVWPHSHPYFYEAQRTAATKAKLKWKANALRHSWISYRLAELQDVNKVALEAGNSPGMIFSNYRELVKPADAKRWFAVRPEKPANVFSMPKEKAA
jgi:integrase